MNTARQALKAAVNKALAQPGAKWTPGTGWTNEPQPRPTVSTYLDSLAADYRRAFDVQLPECLSLAVAAFLLDVKRATGARISESEARRLILGL